VQRSPQNKITNTAGVGVPVSYSEPCQINDAVSLPTIIQHQMRGWENHHLILGMSRLSPYDDDSHNHAMLREAGWPTIRTRFELAPLECGFRCSAKYIHTYNYTHINYTHTHTHTINTYRTNHTCRLIRRVQRFYFLNTFCA